MSVVTVISSRDNPLLKELRRLAQDSGAARKQGRLWLEGDHLCRAALARGFQPQAALFTADEWTRSGATWALGDARVLVLELDLFESISGLPSPARMGFVVALPAAPELAPTMPTVVLDRVQDAGNVGVILRCAAAFGFKQVLALKGTAALWSVKVLRSGMGAHFGLRLIESAVPQTLDALAIPLLATSSHAGQWLHQVRLPWPCAWLLGHEGQGLAADVAARAALQVRIAQPGGEESLNVASAAAICLYASAVEGQRDSACGL